MKFGDNTRVTGVPELTWCYNHNIDDEKVDVQYASIIGSVNYCSVSTRPDITFAVNKCSQFTSNQ